MKCDLVIEKSLKGFTNLWLTTPNGTRVLVSLVMKDKERKSKLEYKLICEYCESIDSNDNKKEKK